MKTKLKIIIFSSIALVMLILGLIFAINYKKESIKYFYDGGYVISNTYDNSDLNKVYFDSNAAYESKGDTYTFKNSDGNKITINEDTFIHYNNGSVMALKDGVAIDLDKIDSKLLSYYNVFTSSILKKTSSGYEISNLNDIVSFNKLMYKISNNKYLVAADNIVVSFADDQTVSMNKYAEIEYVNDNVIRIYNEDVNYQTIASNLFIVVDDVKIDLEYKTISKNGIKYLTMADMVINAADNIEILPELSETSKDKNEKEDNNDDNKSQTNSNNPQNNINNENISKITEELNNIQLPEQNEEIVDEKTFIQPKFTVESMDVTALGFQNLVISADDQSGVLYGNRIVEIIENSTGKVIRQLTDWQEGAQNYIGSSILDLKPNTAYTLNVIGQYKVDDTIYDRTFVSKMFRTLDIGLDVEKDYATSDTLSFIVYKNSYSNVSGFTYVIKDPGGKVIVEDTGYFGSDSDWIKLEHENVFEPNTEYELTIMNIKYGNTAFMTQSYDNLKLTYKIKTLKENQLKNAELDYKVELSTNSINFGLKGIKDTNGGIKTYTYKVYDNNNNLVYSTIKDKYSDLNLNIKNLGDAEAFYYNVEIAFDDNEKTIIYTTENSNLIVVSDTAYPQVVEFKSFEKDENSDVVIDCETLFGEIIIDDADSFIAKNGIREYRVVIKEKANSTIVSQQYQKKMDTASLRDGTRFALPVMFKNLKPNTEYVMYVYLYYNGSLGENLDDNDKYLYIGYANSKTKEPDPIELNLTDFNQDSKNLFAYKVSKTKENETLENVKSIKFGLWGCKDDACSELTSYIRTIPNDEGSIELSDLKQPNGYVDVKASEFDFLLQDYDSDFLYYKIDAKAYAELGYSIPVKITDTSDEESISEKKYNERDSIKENEFIVTILDMPPILEITANPVIKDDCTAGTSCYDNFYKNKTGDNSLDRLNSETIVGYNFEIETATSPITGYAIKPMWYAIYEKTGLECSENLPVGDEYWNSIELQYNNETLFVPAQQNNDTPYFLRGKTYCVAYYGDYDNNKKHTETTYFNLFAEKQPAKIRGFVDSYNGSSVTFKMNIKDVDNSIKRIYLKGENTEIIPNISEDNNNYYKYVFNPIISGKSYPLLLDENLGNEIKTWNIYDTVLDEIKTYSNSIQVNVKTSPGKLIFEVPYDDSTDFDRSRIAGLLVGTGKVDLIDDSANSMMYAEINLSDIWKKYGLSIENKYVNLKDKVKIIYDSGEIEEEKDKFFIKSINEQDQNKYYNPTSNNFLGISTLSIFSRSDDEDIISRIENSEFSSPEGKIGQKISYGDSLPKFIHMNKVNEAATELSGVDDNGKIEVNQTLATSKINSKQTLDGSKESFEIVSEIKENTRIKILLNNGEEAEILYTDGAFNNYTAQDQSNKIREISSDGEKITIVFDNLTDLSDYDYKYSILYKEASESEYSYSYNNSTQKENNSILVHELRDLSVTNTSAEYFKSGWEWNSNKTDMLFSKSIYVKFSVDTDRYELSQNEIMRFELDAIKGDEIIHLIANNPEYIIDKNNSVSINDESIINQLNGDYDIVMRPVIFKDGNKVERFSPRTIIKSGLSVTKEGPEISASSDGTPRFNISITDNDGVLSACPNKLYDEEPIAYDISSGDISKNYYEVLNGRKVVYFELLKLNVNDENINIQYLKEDALNKFLYFKENGFINDNPLGFSPIPFATDTTTLNLYKFFEEKVLTTGYYYFNVKYCKLGQSEPVTEIHPYYIRSNENFNIHYLGTSSYRYMLLFKNPPIAEKNSINKIEYQYYDDSGRKYSRELNNNSPEEEDKFEFIPSEDGDDFLLLLPIDIPRVNNLTVNFMDSNDKIITYYSR